MNERAFRYARGALVASAFAMVAVAAAGVVVSRNDTVFQLEATVADDALRAARGGLLFAEFSSPPFAVVPYGPLYYGPIAAGTRLLGSSPDAAYLSERLLAVFAWLLSAFGAYLVARSLGASRSALVVIPASLAFGIAWPAVGPTQCSAAFELVGLALWLRDRRLLSLSAFIIAVGMKANAVGIVGGLLLAETIAGRIRVAFVSGAMFAAATAIIHGVTAWATHGASWNALYLAVVTDPKNAWTAYGATLEVVRAGLPVIALAAVLVRRDPVALRVLGATVIALALAIVGVSKAGAGTYYFADVAFVMAAAAALGIETLREWSPAVAGGALLALFLAIVPSRALLSTWKQQLVAPSKVSAELNVLGRVPVGPVMSETPEIAVRSGRETWASDPFTLSEAMRDGRADVDTLVAELDRCTVAAVVRLRRPYPERPAYLFRGDSRADERFRQALSARYEMLAQTAEHEILVPNRACGERTARP